MARVRDVFEKSGMSLHALGLLMGYDAESARQSAFQFIKSNNPSMAMQRRFAKAMAIPLDWVAARGARRQ